MTDPFISFISSMTSHCILRALHLISQALLIKTRQDRVIGVCFNNRQGQEFTCYWGFEFITICSPYFNMYRPVYDFFKNREFKVKLSYKPVSKKMPVFAMIKELMNTYFLMFLEHLIFFTIETYGYCESITTKRK